jgi:hypothetical protein
VAGDARNRSVVLLRRVEGSAVRRTRTLLAVAAPPFAVRPRCERTARRTAGTAAPSWCGAL